MQSSPDNKPGKLRQSQPSKSPSPGPGMSPGVLALLAVLGLGVFTILPRLGQHTSPPQQQANPEAATFTLSSNDENNIHVTWGFPVSQQNFWFDSVPAGASCDQNNCTVPRRAGMRQVYFRWFNHTENRWYYFQCPADYSGTFHGIPYTSK